MERTRKIKLSRCVDLLSESCEFVSNGDPVSNILLSCLSQLISEFIWWCPIRSNGWGNICSASISLFLYRCWYLYLKVLYLYLIWDLIYLARTNCARIEATLETYFSVPDSSSEDRQFYIWVTKSVLSGWGCIWIIPDASYAMYLYFLYFCHQSTGQEKDWHLNWMLAKGSTSVSSTNLVHIFAPLLCTAMHWIVHLISVFCSSSVFCKEKIIVPQLTVVKVKE